MRADATVLEQREVPVPQAGAGQVLVRMHAAALNRGEFCMAMDCTALGETGKPLAARGQVKWCLLVRV